MKTITVTGTGSASAAPDIITVFMTVTAGDMDYKNTMEQAAERLAALRFALSGVGFEKDDIKTTSFNVNTEYSHEHTPDGRYERRFKGYTCVHRLKLSFDLDMERLSAVIYAIAGCSCMPEFSLSFGVKDEDGFKAEMLRSAASNARTSAEILAAASGVTLGELISVNYSWGSIAIESKTEIVMMKAAAPMADGAIEFTPEDIVKNDSATFVWEII